MIFHILCGPFHCGISLMFFPLSSLFMLLSTHSFSVRSCVFKPTMERNSIIQLLARSMLNMALCCASRVLTHLSRTDVPNAFFAPSTMAFVHSCSRLHSLLHSGPMPLRHLHIYSTGALVAPAAMKHHMPYSSACHRITQTCAFLDVSAILTLQPPPHIN